MTAAAEGIAGEVVSNFGLPVPLVWIEHYPPETTNGRSETHRFSTKLRIRT